MLYLSEILMLRPDLDSFEELLLQVRESAQGQIHLKIDIKPNYIDTPADWEDKIEGAFSGVYSVMGARKIPMEDDFG